LVRRIDEMGQLLFAPPNVKGWRGAKAWLNTSTVLSRDNFAQALAMGTLWGRGNNAVASAENTVIETAAAPDAPPGTSKAVAPKPADKPEEPPRPKAFDPARVIHEEKVTNAKDIVRLLLDVYLPGGVRPASQAKLIAFVEAGHPKGPALDRRVRETVHAIMTMPEYQLA